MAEAAAAGLCIAIVGAESTGKTTLAAALVPRLLADTGLRVAWVPEVLREWCNHMGRTPQPQEQAPLMRAQHEAIAAAADTHDIVLCDTTALMTAVYSRLLFDDRSLEPRAITLHRRMALTLLMALDLPWVADGMQRDGPHVQQPVDQLLRALLMDHGLPWAVVGGSGAARLEHALDALAPLLRSLLPSPSDQAGSGRGLFSRLAERNAEPASQAWSCAHCDDPACERRSRRQPSPP